MESAARNLHPQVSEDEWRRLGYMDFLSQASPNNLATNPPPPPHPPAVHPMFHYKSPSGNVIWLQYSSASFRPIYDALEPTLSLATAMLLSPASLVFLYSVLYSPRKIVANPSKHSGQLYYVFGQPNPLPDEKTLRERVLSALEKFADWNAFTLMDEKEYSAMHDVHGLTTPLRAKSVDGICITEDNKRGSPTGIRIHKRFTEKLIAWGAGTARANRLIVLNTQFRVAVTICHEIVHALNYAIDTALLRRIELKVATKSTDPIESNEPFWEDQRLAELGAAWESEVFGGKIVEQELEPDTPWFVCKWPGIRNKGGLPQTKGPKKSETWYFIDMHFIDSIQQRSFWDQSLAHDTTILHVPKTLGVRQEYSGSDADPTWSSSRSSEGKNPTEADEYVHRGAAKAAGTPAPP